MVSDFLHSLFFFIIFRIVKKKMNSTIQLKNNLSDFTSSIITQLKLDNSIQVVVPEKNHHPFIKDSKLYLSDIIANEKSIFYYYLIYIVIYDHYIKENLFKNRINYWITKYIKPIKIAIMTTFIWNATGFYDFAFINILYITIAIILLLFNLYQVFFIKEVDKKENLIKITGLPIQKGVYFVANNYHYLVYLGSPGAIVNYIILLFKTSDKD